MADIVAPEMQEVIKTLVNEIASQFSSFYPVLQAIGWAIAAYFVLLIIISIMRYFRGRKQMRLLEDIAVTLHEISSKLEKKKEKKK